MIMKLRSKGSKAKKKKNFYVTSNKIIDKRKKNVFCHFLSTNKRIFFLITRETLYAKQKQMLHS